MLPTFLAEGTRLKSLLIVQTEKKLEVIQTDQLPSPIWLYSCNRRINHWRRKNIGFFRVTIQPARPSASRSRITELQELSGRSRAKLKQYIDEVQPFTFSLGHPTVAFTKSQLFHLLRVLTDETLNMSYTAMEQMVIGAVKRTPVTVLSRTDHFKTRSRFQFPDTVMLGTPVQTYLKVKGSSAFGSDTAVQTDLEREVEAMDSFSENDSSRSEEALISSAFRKPTATISIGATKGGSQIDPSSKGFESTRQISFDDTLSVVRDTVPASKSRKPIPPTRRKGKGKCLSEEGHGRGIFRNYRKDSIFLFWASRSFSQSAYVMVPQMQEAPQERETPQTRSAMALRTFEKRPSRLEQGPKHNEWTKWRRSHQNRACKSAANIHTC